MPSIHPGQIFNIVCIGQNGRLGYEAVIFAASFRAANPAFAGRLLVAEPQPGRLWQNDPRLSDPIRDLLGGLGAEILPFQNRVFGQSYPYGNKIEVLTALPADEPFVFFDTDTIFTAPIAEVTFDFARPAASMRREGTWPQVPLYGPGYGGIWKSLFDRFGLDFDGSLDFGANWWPVDEGVQGDPQYFSVRWTAWMRAGSYTTVSVLLGSADDSWVLVDKSVRVALPGVHAFDPQTLTFDLPAGQYPFDVRFAQRAGTESAFRFRVLGGDVTLCYPDFTGD